MAASGAGPLSATFFSRTMPKRAEKKRRVGDLRRTLGLLGLADLVKQLASVNVERMNTTDWDEVKAIASVGATRLQALRCQASAARICAAHGSI
jgi:hypothetical protein